MTVQQPVVGLTLTTISADGAVIIPEQIRKATGLVPGREVVVGLGERGEAVILTRTQAKRLGETAEQRAARMDRVFASIGDRFSTGQSTAEVMEELRGHRDE